MPSKYSGDGQNLNPQYVYTRQDAEEYLSLDLLCNRPPPENDDEKWALFGAAIMGGKCSIEDLWFIVHTMMDFAFLLDMLFSFRLAIPLHSEPIQVLASHREQFESNPRRVALRYLKSWFFLDLVSSLPMDVILWAIATHSTHEEGDADATLVRILKGLKFAKAARIYRLRKLKSFAATIQTQARRQVWKMFVLAALYLLLCHWIACGLAFIADPSVSPLARIDLEYGRAYNGQTWLEIMDIATIHPFQKYTRAFHFAVQTVALIGDGGITFRLPGEIAYAVLATWIGLAYMLYAISSVCMLVAESSAQDNRYVQEVAQIRFYAESRGLPKELERHMLELHQWRYRTTNLVQETTLTEHLSGGLQQRLGLFRVIGLVSRVPYFQGMDSECVRTMVLFLNTEHYIGGELLFIEGDLCQGCFFLCAGQLALVSRSKQDVRRRQELLKKTRRRVLGEGGEDMEDTEELDEWAGKPENNIAEVKKEGDVLGEEGLLTEWRWKHTIQALSCCELQCLSRESFLSVLDGFPHELDRCHRMAQKLWPHLAFETPPGDQRPRQPAEPSVGVAGAPQQAPAQEGSLSPRDGVASARAAMLRNSGSFWGDAPARASSMNLGSMSRGASFKVPVARMGSIGETFSLKADGRQSAQMGAFQRMIDESSGPLANEVMVLRKQVVQLQLQLAQGFQQQREDLRQMIVEQIREQFPRHHATPAPGNAALLPSHDSPHNGDLDSAVSNNLSTLLQGRPVIRDSGLEEDGHAGRADDEGGGGRGSERAGAPASILRSGSSRPQRLQSDIGQPAVLEAAGVSSDGGEKTEQQEWAWRGRQGNIRYPSPPWSLPFYASSLFTFFATSSPASSFPLSTPPLPPPASLHLPEAGS